MTAVTAELILEAHRLTKAFPNAHAPLLVLDEVSLSVRGGSFVCIVGPSGCGKTTLLRLLAGLTPPSAGEVIFEGERLERPRRRIGFVFQQSNLMPWRSALDNIRLPLELQSRPMAEQQGRARDMVSLVGLAGFEAALPRDLSGGMAQRVALGRALVHEPDLLLLDEPFGALDALTRERMAFELLRIWSARPVTIVMVTHSISEAILVADQVVVLSPRPGKVRLVLDVPLPRPRTQDLAHTPAFGELARQVRAAL
jgi:NitT/TauT family transport system ATP-binding protein